MITPIAGGPLPTMSRQGNGGGSQDERPETAARAATAAPAGMAAAEAELLESLPPAIAYGVTGRLLTNGNQHRRRLAEDPLLNSEDAADTPAEDPHVDQEV